MQFLRDFRAYLTPMRFLAVGLLGAFSLAQDLPADTVVLRSGGRLEGKVREPADPKGYYLVQLESGELLGLQPGEVDRVESDADPKLQEYRRRLAEAGRDADMHWELARWCKGEFMLDHWRRHAEAAIRLDPDHSVARAALDYVKVGSQWVPYDQLQRSNGLVRYKGKWRLPEDIALVQAAEKRETAIKKWHRDFAQLVRGINGRGGAEAIASLKEIRDPHAVPAIVEALVNYEKPHSESLRSIYIELLGEIGTSAAAAGLIRAGMDEPVRALRERAIELAGDIAPNMALQQYTRFLSSNDNKVVRKAGEALEVLEYQRALLPLIEALQTEHKTVEGPAPGRMNVGFGNGPGAGGMQMGGKPKVVTRTYENPEVLAALLALEPGVNYQFDESQWLRWYASRVADYPSDLRRDP